jgi:UDP-galactose transporter B1
MANFAELLLGAGGIYASFLYYGSLQEDVLTYTSPSGEKFKYSWFLQLLESAANVLLGGVFMCFFEGVRSVPQVPYLISGALQVTAKYFTTAAMVAGVSFPVATLAKSSKMVPVMIGQLLLGKAKYTTREYIHVALIVGGTACVSMAGKSKPGGPALSSMGLLYVVLALACDGVVGGTQKRLKAELAKKQMKERNFEMQFLTNLYMLLTAAVLTFAIGELEPGYKFLVNNPGVLFSLIQFSICSAVGQAFIFFLISRFDSLVCTTVTTTRKVFSVLLSIFTKGHQLNTQGWIGIASACLGILGELQQKFAESMASKAKKSDGNSSGKSKGNKEKEKDDEKKSKKDNEKKGK